MVAWPTADSIEVTADATWLTADNGDWTPPAPPPAPKVSVDDYLRFITSYHRGKPKFAAMIRALVEPLVAIQDFIAHLPIDFDLDVAIGVQLDVVGEWVGRTRFVETPIPNVYFSFDEEMRGFDLGVWKGPNDNDFGVVRLDDETYRTLLRAKIAANNWDGTLETAKDALSIIFPNGETLLFVLDNQDMSMTFGVAGKVPSILFLSLLSRGYVPLKPEGVEAVYAITSSDGAPVFGFDVESEFIGGFDSGAWAVSPEFYFDA
jgi:hypothetical protein